MKFLHFIPHVNRLDLTKKAIASVRGTVADGKLIVIDNSNTAECVTSCIHEALRPSVPLTTAQTMNWMRKIAIMEDLDCFGFQHNDGEPGPGTIDTLYAIAEARSEPWGVLFTHYDVCCVFNVEAVKAVGEWDWLRFPFYFLDNDYYRRLEAAGYPCIQTGLPCAHHNDASNTIKADETRKLVNSHFFPVSEQLYKLKWNECE